MPRQFVTQSKVMQADWSILKNNETGKFTHYHALFQQTLTRIATEIKNQRHDRLIESTVSAH